MVNKYKVVKKHIWYDLDDTITDEIILATSKADLSLKQATTLLASANDSIDTDKQYYYLQETDTSKPVPMFYERILFQLSPL
jgi:hypothetical protein